MAAPKKVPPTDSWSLDDLRLLTETLESTETALQGIAGIEHADMVLQLDTGVVACHHDGSKWWVTFR